MKFLYFLLISCFLFLSVNFSFAQKNDNISFEQQNKKNRYISFSFGGGANYGENKSLKTYIEYELPFYNNLSQQDKLSQFATGFELFGGAEFQLSRNLSLKGEYSYFIKSYNAPTYPNYDFSYYNHQPSVTLYYLIPQQYSFVKLGAGAGYLISGFTKKAFSSESSYKSTGFAFKLDAVLDIQMGNGFAGYIAGYINKTFQGDLKDSDGNLLKNRNNENVDLSSLGLGIRLGFEIFLFNK
ncbi:MAG TPA: hypothetical protein VIK14_14855 [Ignavibacteria bacterium]